jgi:DNA polymerase-3 subunit delta'
MFDPRAGVVIVPLLWQGAWDRKMQFCQIAAQESAIRILRRALGSGKVPHAYIFSGPPGVGKGLAASIMAAALNCPSGGDDACGSCPSCGKIGRAVHPDVLRLSLPEGRKAIPVEAVRALGSRLMVRAHEGRAKVAIIDPADMMTEPAANALLKTLEEPGAGRFLILVTARLSSLLPTVRSRCQVVRFHPLPEETIAQLLSRRGVPPESAATAAAFSEGSMDRAEAFLGESIEEQVGSLLAFLESGVANTPLKGLDVVEKLRRGKRPLRDETLSLIDMAPTLLTEILWLRVNPEGRAARQHPVNQILGDRLQAVAEKLSTRHIAAFAFSFHHAKQAILNNNMNPQLALEGVLMSARGRLYELATPNGFLGR